MSKRHFGIERRDLSEFRIAEVKLMIQYLHTVAGDVSQSDIGPCEEALDDVEEAMTEELLGIGRVLLRVAKRLERELARRALLTENLPTRTINNQGGFNE